MPGHHDSHLHERDRFLGDLRVAFTTLSPQFQAASRYILDHPDELPVVSMRSIAVQAGVQPATLVRLAKSLGFEGWQDLRALFVQAWRHGYQPYANRARQVVRKRGASKLVDEQIDAQQRNLTLWREANDPAMLERAAALLDAAGTVYIGGFRASFAIAYAFHYVYRLFRPSVQLIRGDAGALEMELRDMKKNDVVFAISFAPYSQEIIKVVETAHAAGCKVIALTDSSVAPIALRAHCTLQFSVQSPSFFPSISAGVAAVEVLAAQLLSRQGAKAVKALAAAEAKLNLSGAYLHDTGSQDNLPSVGQAPKRKRKAPVVR